MLESSDITFQYQAGQQWSFPNLTCKPGEHWLILGDSGSGKTTWLHLLTGLLVPHSGTVTVDGLSLFDLPEAKRDRLRGERMGIVFQNAHLIPSLTLLQNLRLAGSLIGNQTEADAVDALLQQLQLEGKKDQLPATLSQGESQRAAIARALINQPQYIFADEPTSALDDTNAERVIQLLEHAADQQGAALIVVTHDKRLRDRFTNTVSL